MRILKSIAFAAFASTIVVTLSAPAGAVSIKHTNWAAGDPAADRVPTARTAPPADTTAARYFDKSHEAGTASR